MAEKVSFTVRRPTPVSRPESDSDSSSFKVPALPRHLSGASTPNSPLVRGSPPTRTYSERDSSDEDGSEAEDELVTAFDKFGAQRCVSSSFGPRAGPQLTTARLHDSLHERPKPQGPLVIPALKNRDWRELARKRKQLYVPPSAAAATGADGSVGGLGTRDTINSGPQASGLQIRKRAKLEDADMDTPMSDADTASTAAEATPKPEETEDDKALRAILASAAAGGDGGLDGPQIDAIPAPSEDDAYRQDVEELPDSASLADYERVPVAQFGAALLRGMGWKEGQAASRKQGKGLVEPWLPQARPALLGIGAKEREVFDDGSKGKKGAKARPEKRYVPVVRQERAAGKGGEGERERDRERDRDGGSSSRPRSPSSRNGSRRPSRSPSPGHRRDRDTRRDDRDHDHNRYRGNGRDRDREDRHRDRDRRRDDDYDSSRKDRDRRRDRSRSKDRYDSSRRRDKDRY